MLTLLSLPLLIVLIVCFRLTVIQPAADMDKKHQAVELALTAHSVLANRLPGPEYSAIYHYTRLG